MMLSQSTHYFFATAALLIASALPRSTASEAQLPVIYAQGLPLFYEKGTGTGIADYGPTATYVEGDPMASIVGSNDATTTYVLSCHEDDLFCFLPGDPMSLTVGPSAVNQFYTNSRLSISYTHECTLLGLPSQTAPVPAPAPTQAPLPTAAVCSLAYTNGFLALDGPPSTTRTVVTIRNVEQWYTNVDIVNGSLTPTPSPAPSPSIVSTVAVTTLFSPISSTTTSATTIVEPVTVSTAEAVTQTSIIVLPAPPTSTITVTSTPTTTMSTNTQTAGAALGFGGGTGTSAALVSLGAVLLSTLFFGAILL